MGVIGSIFIYLLFLFAGFCLQFLARWSPLINLAASYLMVLFLPPAWSLGLTSGIWIACAFFTYNPEQEHHLDTIPAISFRKILLSSVWTFSGFLLTLIFLWKLKVQTNLDLGQRELLAWAFLGLIEICLYRVIARLSPSLYRIPLGYGMAVFNFLLLFYWIYSLGIVWMALIFFTFLIINPLLLLVVDLPAGATKDSIFRRK